MFTSFSIFFESRRQLLVDWQILLKQRYFLQQESSTPTTTRLEINTRSQFYWSPGITKIHKTSNLYRSVRQLPRVELNIAIYNNFQMFSEATRNTHWLQSCGTRNDLNKLPGDDGLPGPVEGDPQLVNHLGWKFYSIGYQKLIQVDILQAFLEELSMAVILELCSEVAPSFRA